VDRPARRHTSSLRDRERARRIVAKCPASHCPVQLKRLRRDWRARPPPSPFARRSPLQRGNPYASVVTQPSWLRPAATPSRRPRKAQSPGVRRALFALRCPLHPSAGSDRNCSCRRRPVTRRGRRRSGTCTRRRPRSRTGRDSPRRDSSMRRGALLLSGALQVVLSSPGWFWSHVHSGVFICRGQDGGQDDASTFGRVQRSSSNRGSCSSCGGGSYSRPSLSRRTCS